MLDSMVNFNKNLYNGTTWVNLDMKLNDQLLNMDYMGDSNGTNKEITY